MCTAISYNTNCHYFGRNLDLEHRYSESITITPRNYPFRYCSHKAIDSHYAMIGMATVLDDYPLYYEATNEHGLSMAGLNFPGNAVYFHPKAGFNNISPFEFIPWILCQCQTVAQARAILSKTKLVDIPFKNDLPLSPLHWMLSDKHESIVIEPMSDGLNIHNNPIGVLTNNPPFAYQLYNLSNYLNQTRDEPVNRFSEQINLQPYSRGMGAIGLPGDLSSVSRFVRASFTKLNSVTEQSEESSVCQFFHILGAVAQQNGCVKVNGAFEKTIYSSCCNTDRGIYYYTTYENSQITGIHLFHENLDANTLLLYPYQNQMQVRYEN